jgi:hypothetical protein
MSNWSWRRVFSIEAIKPGDKVRIKVKREGGGTSTSFSTYEVVSINGDEAELKTFIEDYEKSPKSKKVKRDFPNKTEKLENLVKWN